MASTGHVVYAAIIALVFWTSLGAVLLRRVVAPGLVLPFAPIVGWAVHSAIAVVVFTVLPFTTITVVGVAFVVFACGVALSRVRPTDAGEPEPGPTAEGRVIAFIAIGLALLLAAACAAAILPKGSAQAVYLADPIFDHSKIALVDEIARTGVPPGNPFFGGEGADHLAYYYLWHFSAGEVARTLGITGWEADAAMTFFSAFASLAVMMGLAVRLSGRVMASVLTVFVAASSSGRVVALAIFGAPLVDDWVSPPGGFAGWLFQSAWVPQHVASAACVLVAVWLMTTLATRVDAVRIGLVALLVAAGFESSTWIGGVVFALVAIVVAPILLVRADPRLRLRLLAGLAVAGLLALALAWPFVRDQLASAATRQGTSPIAVTPFPVLDERMPMSLRNALDVPAFWLLLLPMEFVAIYLPGLFAMRRLLRDRPERRTAVLAFAALAIVALLCSGLLRSTLADNNDLSWRAGLLAATALIVFTAAGLAVWLGERRRLAATLTLCALAIGTPEAFRLIAGNFVGVPRPGAETFAHAPDAWSRVRELTGPAERVANNPLSLSKLTPWAVNIGWALLANRRSCYAAWELDQVYTSVPHERLHAINDRFERVFAGTASNEDFDEVSKDYDCSVVLVTPEDGAWTRDPFAASDRYALIDARAGRWRIYRRR